MLFSWTITSPVRNVLNLPVEHLGEGLELGVIERARAGVGIDIETECI